MEEGQTQAVNGRTDTSRKWKKDRHKPSMEEGQTQAVNGRTDKSCKWKDRQKKKDNKTNTQSTTQKTIDLST